MRKYIPFFIIIYIMALSCGRTGFEIYYEADGQDGVNNIDGSVTIEEDDHDSNCVEYYIDSDGDGLGSPGQSILSCSSVAGYVANADDCDDSSALCNSLCQDDDLDQVWDCKDDCVDSDLDGYGEDGGGGNCLGVDCDDTSSLCNTVCLDADSDLVWDCKDNCIDSDGDNYGTDGGGGVCLGTDCDDTSGLCNIVCEDLDSNLTWDCKQNCLDPDGDGYGTNIVAGGCLGSDCDESSTLCNSSCLDADSDLVWDCKDNCIDSDGDNYGTDGGGGSCTGTDCDDTSSLCNTVCLDADSDLVWDCKDNCIDSDGDNYGTDGGGGSCTGTDCDDTSILCNSVCLDADSDLVWDCKDNCIDSDGDNYGTDGGGGSCTGTDCDDTSILCNSVCLDADSDLVWDCKDNCIDSDGDNYGTDGGGGSCAGTDCDDTSSLCNTACLDADSDLVWDCKDNCIDSDGDNYGTDGGGGSCTGTDCDDTSSLCNTVCLDADSDLVWDCKDNCIDLDGDGYGTDGPAGVCLGADCDDNSEFARPGLAEGPTGDPTCSDGLDNDCSGDFDAGDPACQSTENIVLYRSVGINPANLNTPNYTVEISGFLATFSGSLPDNIGLGDVIQYQDASVTYIAFIHGRTSASVFSVRSSTGLQAQPTTASSAEIYRAFTSLENWDIQDENDNLDDLVEDFDSDKDLVANQNIMAVACYADGIDNSSVTIDDWITGIDSYIKIFTPTTSQEVGVSQRHSGKWGDGYQRTLSIIMENNNIWLDGLSTRSSTGRSYFAKAFTEPGEIEISNCFGHYTGNSAIGGVYDIWNTGGSTLIKIWNCIGISDSSDYLSHPFYMNSASPEYYLYNCTGIANAANGFQRNYSGGNCVNCLGQSTSASAFSGGWSTIEYCASNDDTADNWGGSGNKINQDMSQTFEDPTNYDFHLSASDPNNVALDAATDLSSDTTNPFSTDIDGQTRSGNWDIGADEVP
jgi:hypothetical protein